MKISFLSIFLITFLDLILSSNLYSYDSLIRTNSDSNFRNPLSDSKNNIIIVSNVNELKNAAKKANTNGNTTIILKNGTYILDNQLYVAGNNIAFTGESGKRDEVFIRGRGMDGNVSHIFNVTGKNFKAANMTIGWVENHAIQIHGENNADNPVISNVRFVNTNEQMIKISFKSGDKIGSDNGIVENCIFEYPEGAGPQYYIAGIDGLQCRNWIIRNNIFKNIRSPERKLSQYAIHFWAGSENTTVENNLIINCDRGIGFGMGKGGHLGGTIRNNMVYTTRDVGICLENSPYTKIYNNTVYTKNYSNSIEYRFPGTYGVKIVNNLTTKRIAKRDNASAVLDKNITHINPSVFINPDQGDLHLKKVFPGIVDAGKTLPEVTKDFDNENRPNGNAYDIGGDEYHQFF